jgi:cytochrome P450
MMLQQILFMDAPDHTRIRSICAVAFTPGRIAHLRESIQQIADSLIDRVAPTGQIELLGDFAGQLPALVLCAMLGLPESDHPQLRTWASDFGELLGNFEHDPDRLPELTRSLGNLRDYIEAAVAEQTASPQNGLISAWIQAEVGGSRLSFDEVVANTILMIAGGLEEITNLIANGMLSLLLHPDQLTLLSAHPEIMQSAVEEILRYESTTQYTGRVAPHDIELHGKQIREGDAVTAVLAAANRDPDRFPKPEQLDLTRSDNRHLAFSWASHYCLGAPLARMTGAVAFSSLLRRLSGVSLITAHPQWRGMAATRGIRELYLQFRPGPALLPQG